MSVEKAEPAVRPAKAPKRSEETRNALLDAAARMFFRNGYDRASLQEIADITGIQKGSIYYHYRSKEMLLFDVLKLIHDRHLDNVRDLASRAEGSSLQRLQSILRGHTLYVCANIEDATVLAREFVKLDREQAREILGEGFDYQRVFRDLIEGAREEGEVPDWIEPKLATLWVLGALNTLHRWYRPHEDFSELEIAETFSQQLARGISMPSANTVGAVESQASAKQ